MALTLFRFHDPFEKSITLVNTDEFRFKGLCVLFATTG